MPNNNETVKYTVKSEIEISQASMFPIGGILGDILIGPIKELFNESVDDLVARFKEISEIDRSKIKDFPEDAPFFVKDQILNEIVDQRREFFKNNPIDAFKQQLKDVFVDTGIQLRIEDVIAEKPELDIIFSDRVRKEINDSVANFIVNQKGLIDKALEKRVAINEGGEDVLKLLQGLPIEDILQGINEKLREGINELPIPEELKGVILDKIESSEELKKLNEQTKQRIEDQKQLIPGLKERSTLEKDLADSTKSHAQSVMEQSEVMQRSNSILELTDEELLGLQGKYAMLTDESGNYTDAAKQASTTTAKLTDRNSTLETSQDQVNKSLKDGSVAYENASENAENYGDTVDQLQNQGGFFEGIKQGFEDFVESVGSNSELIADFFANTLSQMSQNFSDLFYNVLTGKFDDLKDLAKQAFEAILRAFLDLVSAIATRQIVISIAGVLGFDTKGASAGDVLGIGKQAAGIALDLAGVFGGGGGAAAGGAAVAGGATSIGTGTVAIGSSLGGISSVGTGATAVGEVEHRLAA